MYKEIDLNNIVEGINRMLEVVAAETGASPMIANFLLSTVGKQDFNILNFTGKVDSGIFDTAMKILFLLRKSYHDIIDILNETVNNNEELLKSISMKRDL